MPMGCYGIGVTRVVAACIEQNHDEKGIIWPENIAPFQLVIVQLDAHKSAQVPAVAGSIYEQATAMGIEVLLDDRDKKISPGVKFAESELLGILTVWSCQPEELPRILSSTPAAEPGKNVRFLHPLSPLF